MPSRPTTAWALLQLFGAGRFGARWQNGIWYKPDGTLPGSFNIQTAVAAMFTAAKTALTPIMNENSQLLGARFYVNNGTYTASADDATAIAGDLSGGALPPDDFIVVRSQSDISGRKGKGRILLSGLDISVVDSGRINAGGVTAMATIITWLRTSVSAGGSSFTAQQYDHVTNALHLPVYWSYNPVVGNKKKRSPVL